MQELIDCLRLAGYHTIYFGGDYVELEEFPFSINKKQSGFNLNLHSKYGIGHTHHNSIDSVIDSLHEYAKQSAD